MESRFLVFMTGGRTFAMNFSEIRVIVAATKPEAIPDFPEYVLGTITNNGEVVPVIDLRRRFGYEAKELSDRDCIIVTDTEKNIGLLCDSISGFTEVAEDKILPAPNFSEEAAARFITGEFLTEGSSPCYILSPMKIIRPEDEGTVLSTKG